MLLNVGPTHDGRIVPIFEERLLDLGELFSFGRLLSVCIVHLDAFFSLSSMCGHKC